MNRDDDCPYYRPKQGNEKPMPDKPEQGVSIKIDDMLHQLVKVALKYSPENYYKKKSETTDAFIRLILTEKSKVLDEFRKSCKDEYGQLCGVYNKAIAELKKGE